VSCTSASFCMAVDASGNTFMYNGGSWSVSGISSTYQPSGLSVSCSSSSFCKLVTNSASGNNGNAVTYENYDGVSWTNAYGEYDLVGLSYSPSELSCVSPSFCVNVGGDFAATFNGSAWMPSFTDSNQPNFGQQQYQLSSVSCPTTSFCVAVDLAGNAYTYNGASWGVSVRIDSSSAPVSVSCASASFCVVVAEGQSGHLNEYTLTYSTATPPRTHHAKRKHKHKRKHHSH